MPVLHLIPHASQHEEPWANGAGTTRVILREPDGADWRIRVSVAKVDADGPFSELAGTRRTLIPLDAPMTLRLPDGREMHAARLGTLQFDGAPAPFGTLPEGPTRDFNLMLRGTANGAALPRTLVDKMLLTAAGDTHWLVYLDSGRATLRTVSGAEVELNPHDAALVIPDDVIDPVSLEGAGEIVLVKLYA